MVVEDPGPAARGGPDVRAPVLARRMHAPRWVMQGTLGLADGPPMLISPR